MSSHRTSGGEPKLVIFDCDGTLVDSQHVIIGAMKMAFEAYGQQVPDDQAVRSIIGLSLLEAVSNLAPSDCDPLLLDKLTEGYKQAFVEQRKSADFHEPLFDGAREVLQELSGRENVLLGVATGKSRRGVDVLFEREGLAGYFHDIQTADDAPSKPHPGMIDNAMAAMGVSAPNVLMIGDTSYDMQMAINAGVRAVGVSWGYHEDEHLQQAGAHHLLSGFEQIHDLVDE